MPESTKTPRFERLESQLTVDNFVAAPEQLAIVPEADAAVLWAVSAFMLLGLSGSGRPAASISAVFSRVPRNHGTEGMHRPSHHH